MAARVAKIVALFMGFISLFGRFKTGSTLSTDISCLKSLKDSLHDPFGYLSNWDFSNSYEGFICQFVGVDCWTTNENTVLNLGLSGMGLIGHFPASLRNCSGLTGLDISFNQISGPIPSDINLILPFVTTLDLSHNQLSGIIPPSIVNCSFLNQLNLDSNNLSGPIPDEISLMPRLKFFNFTNNPDLCGYNSLKPCKNHSDHKTNLPLFFRGLLTGWAVFMSLVFLICWFALPQVYVKKLTNWGKKKKKRPRMNKTLRRSRNTTSNHFKITEMDKYATRIPFRELTDATGSFSHDNLIGIGKTGTTYKATIQNGWFLAVKWLFNSDHLDTRIASEIITLGRLKHRSLVPLIGFCLEKDQTFLVYKYMSNGNLYDWLHLRKGEGEIMGYWPLRLKIAVGIAEGLAWLHQKSNLTVIHTAISSKCILLDKNFEPKISNFWEAKILKSKNSTSKSTFSQIVAGDSQELKSDKEDVYLFGILLLELITGKEPQELASSVSNLGTASVLDVSLELDETPPERGFDDEIHQCLELAKKCLLSNPGQRPSMVQLHATLAALL